MNPGCEPDLAAPLPADVSQWIESSTRPGFYQQSLSEMNADLTAALQRIAAVPDADRTFANTVLEADAVLDRLSSRGITLKTIASLRDLPEALKKETEQFESGYLEGLARFFSNAVLYAALNKTETAPGVETELKLALIRSLKNGGAALGEEARRKISELTGKGAALSAQFRSALQNDKTTVGLTQSDLAGVSPDFIAKYMSAEGNVLLPVADPSIVEEFLKTAANEDARRKVYLAYRGRNPENAERLLQYTRANSEIAALNGKPNWLEKMIDERALSGGWQNVETLLRDLEAGMKPALAARLKTMNELKAADGSNEPVQVWDLFYYDSRIPSAMQTAGGEDPAALAADYFPATTFLNAYFGHLNRTFAIEFQEVPGAPVWHQSVKLYLVRDARAGGKPVGYIYFDLFNRSGKNASTAFVEEFVARRRLENGKERLPVAVLMTNWGPWEERATLNVSLDDVQTTMHEMGHALHAMFQQGAYYNIGGWRHPQDYMEVPSTSLDKQIKIPEVLVSLSGHRADPSRKLPLDLAKKLATRQKGFQVVGGDFFSGSHMLNTVFLSLLDIEVQKRIGSLNTPADLHALYRERFQEFYGIDPTAEDHFLQTFHHISGEYAGYYSSYIQAGIAAANVVERLQELGGVMDPDAVLKWRREMLEAPAQETKASEIMETFLGRKISVEPIFREQGLR